MQETEQHIYIAIDLKSFYASVECKERGLNPLTTNLVVADSSRTEKTICLAVSPSLKKYGIPGRARLFEVVQKVKGINIERRRRAPNNNITGLNTAATVWCSAAIGILCGIGLVAEAIIGTVFVLLSNIFLRKISYQLSSIEPSKEGYLYSLKIACKPKDMTIVRNDINEFCNKEHVTIERIDVIEKTVNKCTIIVCVRIPSVKLNFMEHVMNAMTLNENIISIGWKKEFIEENKESEI